MAAAMFFGDYTEVGVNLPGHVVWKDSLRGQPLLPEAENTDQASLFGPYRSALSLASYILIYTIE